MQENRDNPILCQSDPTGAELDYGNEADPRQPLLGLVFFQTQLLPFSCRGRQQECQLLEVCVLFTHPRPHVCSPKAPARCTERNFPGIRVTEGLQGRMTLLFHTWSLLPWSPFQSGFLCSEPFPDANISQALHSHAYHGSFAGGTCRKEAKALLDG